MNKQSLSSFNKITLEMERLSQLITKEENFREELQNALQNASLSDSEEAPLQNIDLLLKQYNNPTTKSLPYDPEPDFNSRVLDADSETINTIYRNFPNDFSLEGDRQNIQDDKSTVILAGLKKIDKKETEEEGGVLAKQSSPNYSSLNIETRSSKKQAHPTKFKKSTSKNATASMPSQAKANREHYKSQNHFPKNSSITKASNKIQSPLISQSKNKKTNNEIEQEGSKDCRGKLAKISKIDREELNKLQQKKNKKSQLSSNRKKTKRGLGTAKSTSNVMQGKMAISSTNYTSQKSYGNSSCKKFDSYKRDNIKREEKLLPNHQDWQRMEKTNKKLNRVNICKLQQNMKKAYQKKHVSTNKLEKKQKKTTKFQSYHKDHQDLKLHFTDEDEETTMKKLIEEKELNKEYSKQTNKYIETANKMSKTYFQALMKQCRETSEEAILKIKLVTLVLYFFDQFASAPLLSSHKISPKSDEFFTSIAQQQIIEVLLHPKKVIKIIESLPSILMNDNIISAERIRTFMVKFSEINQQLDQQLQFFLIKKGNLYMFIHALTEYIGFLLQKQLVQQTKRSKIIPTNPKEPLHGFYSGRSKREEIAHKYIKRNEGNNKLGFRCDSDRKITLQDQDFCFRELAKVNRKEALSKVTQLKKIFK